MEYAIGVIIAVAVGLFANAIGLDRERAFYTAVLIVVATYYMLFAAMADSSGAMLSEATPVFAFMAAAGIGFRKNPWIIVTGLAMHGVFDFFHHDMITNPGVPAWWPGFCLGYDVAAAIFLAVLIVVRRAPHGARPAA